MLVSSAQSPTAAVRQPPAVRRLTRGGASVAAAVTGIVAVAVFAVAYGGGGYSTEARSAIGVVVWTAVAAVLLVGPRTRPSVPRATVAVIVLLLAFGVLSLASATWGASAEAAFTELNRVLLYTGIVALVVLLARREHVDRWLDGIALAIVAVAAVALGSRFFPQLFDERQLPTFLPDARTRLGLPVDYWNGLAALVALAVPLLARNAVERTRLVAVGSVGAIPLALTTIYLTSSRGGALAALAGSGVFVALSRARWRAVGALSVGGGASVAVVAFLATRDVVVNGPFDSAEATAQGRLAAVVLLVACGAAAAAWASVPQWLARRVALPRRAGHVAAAALGLALTAAAVAAEPGERLREFKQAPPAVERNDVVQSHLLSSSGNWRWQYWQASLDQFRARPLTGGGAGSFEAWWAEHGTTVAFIENPHSLYFQVLGELGLPGLLLVLAIVLVGLAAGVLRSLRSSARGAAAAATAAFAAFVLAAGADWMWQLTVVTAAAMVLLGLLTGSATADGGGVKWTPAVRRALALVAVVVAALQLDVWAADDQLATSRSAAARGDWASARAAADAARRLLRAATARSCGAAEPAVTPVRRAGCLR